MVNFHNRDREKFEPISNCSIANVSIPSDTADKGRGRILANDAQLSGERTVLRLLKDPDVIEVMNELNSQLRTWPRGLHGDAAERIEHDVVQWTVGLIMDEVNAAIWERPDFVIGADTTPHRWFGHTFPGNGKAGDNPDAIYRLAIIDGSGRYEVSGKLDMSKPLLQIVFEISAGTMIHPVSVEQDNGEEPNPDAGIMKFLGAIDGDELNISPDGSFRFTIGEDRREGNHLPSAPGPCTLNCRQMLHDWSTPPVRLTIRRLDDYMPTFAGFEEIKKAVVANLPSVVRFWAGFTDAWLGGIPANEAVPPVAREGGWGYIAGVRFELAPGEAAVVTIHPGQARYMGFQLTDPWMIALESGLRQCCLNLEQAIADEDGRYTFVISPVDPGVANWLDTCGLNDGLGIIRWQGLTAGDASSNGMYSGFRILPLSEVEKMGGVARITPEERSKALAARREGFFSRFTAE